MKIGSTETVAAPGSVKKGSRTTRGRRLGTIRAIAYWGLWFFLVFSFLASTHDIWDYKRNPTTYHQVYLDAALHERVAWAYAALTGIAIPFQAAGWRGRRFSKIAVAVFGLHVCFAVADHAFGIIAICCT
jgi:hypothetical protein